MLCDAACDDGPDAPSSDSEALQRALDVVRQDAHASWACALPVQANRIAPARLISDATTGTATAARAPTYTIDRVDGVFLTVLRQRSPFFVNRLSDGRLAGLPPGQPRLHSFAIVSWRPAQRVEALVCVANVDGGFSGPLVSRLQATLDVHAQRQANRRDAVPVPYAHPANALHDGRCLEMALTRLVPIGILQLSPDWSCIHANNAWCALSGRNMEQTLGAGWLDALHPPHDRQGRTTMQQALEAGGTVERALRVTDTPVNGTAGTSRWLELHVTPLDSEPGQARGALLVVNDITGRREDAERMRRLAHRDALTGLTTRARFLERLGETLRDGEGIGVALLFLDLDGFKTVNNTRGHATGDALLRLVGERLIAASATEEDVARLGGDEFIVMVRSDDALRDACRLAATLVSGLRMPFHIDEHPLYLSSSIGIAVADTDAQSNTSDVETLFNRADAALHRAKERGRSRYAVFTDEIDRTRRRDSSLHADLRRAVEHQEFALHYQPQLMIREQRLLGFEALLRWPRGIAAGYTPQETVEALERTRLISDVGDRVIADACRSWRRWRELGLIDESVTMSVNVSVQQLGMVGFAERLTATLERESMPPERLIVEITESALVQDSDSGIIDVIKRLGTQISLDDFGTGYSSLSYLGQLPLDHLKIDRSFIQDLGQRPQAITIVKSILALARSLGIEVIAEGVEDARVLPLLEREGCAAYQGFQFSRPLAGDDIESLLATLDPIRLGHICNFIDLGDARAPLDVG